MRCFARIVSRQASVAGRGGSIHFQSETRRRACARGRPFFFRTKWKRVHVVLLTCCSTMVVIMGDWEAHIQVARESSRLLKVRSAGLDMISDLSDKMARRYVLDALCVSFNGIKPDMWIPCHPSLGCHKCMIVVLQRLYTFTRPELVVVCVDRNLIC
jgi:hypothetical protein